MRANKYPRIKKWFLFFPSTNFKDVACHYWLSYVWASSFDQALICMGAKRNMAIGEKHCRRVFHNPEYHSIKTFEWKKYFKYPKIETKVYDVTIETTNGGDWHNQFLVTEIPPQLEKELEKIDCKYKGLNLLARQK